MLALRERFDSWILIYCAWVLFVDVLENIIMLSADLVELIAPVHHVVPDQVHRFFELAEAAQAHVCASIQDVCFQLGPFIFFKRHKLHF